MLLASSTALVAQEEGWFKPYIAMGFCFAQGHAHDMTQTTWGGLGAYNVELGTKFILPKTNNVEIRPNFGMARLLSKDPTEEHPMLYDLVGMYVGFDVVFTPFGKLPLSLTTGPTFISWNVDQVHNNRLPAQGETGTKFGWRLGVGYKITDRWSANLTFTQTEWRTLRNTGTYNYGTGNPFQTDPPTTIPNTIPGSRYIPGFNPSRPAYFMVSAVYRI